MLGVYTSKTEDIFDKWSYSLQDSVPFLSIFYYPIIFI